MKVLVFVSLLFLFVSCFDISFDEDFTYDDIVRIFAISQYVKGYGRIEAYLVPEYRIDKIVNQEKYGRLLSEYVDTDEKWNKFLKDTIDYYILFRKSGELEVSYYREGGYNEKLKFFDSNYLIDIDRGGFPSRYWRVEESKGSYIKSKKLYKLFLFSKEHNISSRVRERLYYDESRYILKKEVFGDDGSMKDEWYYYYNRRI